MSVRVNLLPASTRHRDRASRQRSIAALAGVLLLAVLGGVYWWASAEVSRTEDRLRNEQARSAELRRAEAELVAFRSLADQREVADEILITALGGEVSFAGILQDVAAVMPSDAQLESLTVSLDAESRPVGPTVGSFAVSGKTLTAHAPGTERLLLSLGRVVSFRDLYLNSSSLTDTDTTITSFSVQGRVGPEAATGRYVAGLPEFPR